MARYEAMEAREESPNQVMDIDNKRMLSITQEKIEQLHIGLQDYAQELVNRRDEMLRERSLLLERADLLEMGAQEINEFLASEWKMNQLDKAKKAAQEEKAMHVPSPMV